jgi:zinc transporter ZupT
LQGLPLELAVFWPSSPHTPIQNFFSITLGFSAGVMIYVSMVEIFVKAKIALLFLMPFLNDIMFGIIFAAVAGIMVFISQDELLPAAKRYDEAHLSIYGLIGGMAVMALSLLLFI